jgi:membrane protease subunit (stomatin/prohibitin family)
MSRNRKRKLSLKHKVVAGVGAAALAVGVAAVTVSTSQAGEACAGLDQALQNNQNFIAAQKANPDAQSDARIANRQAVVDLIQQRRQAAGCR